MSGPHQEIKLCVLGDSGVGKSSIVQRFVHNTFNPSVESTIGASFMTKCILVDDCTFKFNIWDTAGQERYRSLAPMYYRNAGAAVIVYDVTSQGTFQAVKSWIRELQLHGSTNVIIAIAGNKADLEGRREVTYKEAKEYARTVNAAFVETSALTAVNIHDLFKEIGIFFGHGVKTMCSEVLKIKNSIFDENNTLISIVKRYIFQQRFACDVASIYRGWLLLPGRCSSINPCVTYIPFCL